MLSYPFVLPCIRSYLIFLYFCLIWPAFNTFTFILIFIKCIITFRFLHRLFLNFRILFWFYLLLTCWPNRFFFLFLSFIRFLLFALICIFQLLFKFNLLTRLNSRHIIHIILLLNFLFLNFYCFFNYFNRFINNWFYWLFFFF